MTEKKKNILMISPRFRPLVGGYEMAAERLSKALVQAGHNVDVVTLRHDSGWPKKENSDGLGILRLWCVAKPGRLVLTSVLSYALFMLFRSGRYDVVHIHQYGIHASVVIAIAKLLRKPVVLKLTNTGEEGIAESFEEFNPLLRRFLINTHRSADGYVALSQATHAEALRFGVSEDKVHVVGNGVDTLRITPPDAQTRAQRKAEKGLDCDCLVLYAGRLAEGKNPLGLLDAWSKIAARFPRSQLIIAGDGPLSPNVSSRIVELNLEDSVTAVGQQSDLLFWYQAADISVIPSYREGLSNTLLEAMSSGLPVVSTRVSGSEDIFAKADIGELVDVGDMDGFAEGLSRLMSLPERRLDCGQRARQFVVETYSLKKVSEAINEIYEVLL